mmetsp:Transcript_14948/g.14813  ORF Transcript_14948/g.14813 Transcript_14948/m.14813 type:complete len:269 (-) Transcript_14948:2562-3368(-)
MRRCLSLDQLPFQTSGRCHQILLIILKKILTNRSFVKYEPKLRKPLDAKKKVKPHGVRLMTINLMEHYQKCFPEDRKCTEQQRKLKIQFDANLDKTNSHLKHHRILTKIPPDCYEFYNNGYDLPNGDYIIREGDIILSPEGQEYHIQELIGQGTFGQVIKCMNMSTRELVAIKVLKNKRTYRNQGSVEIKILHTLNCADDMNDSNIVQMLDYFVFREHLCIVFELLSYSLYDLLERNKFSGLSLNLSRLLISQILQSLELTKKVGLIH